MTRAARLLVAACAAVVVQLLAAAPAFAHSDQGAMTAEARPSTGAMAVTARARVVFANDGHPANEAAVTVTGSGPGGAQVGPTPLSRVDDGEYEALVPVPAAGDWSFQLDSTNPTATATAAAATVAAPQAVTPPSLGSAKSATRSDDDDSSGLNASVFAIAGGAVAVAALVGGTLVIRRRR
jgi:hypothetical protein